MNNALYILIFLCTVASCQSQPEKTKTTAQVGGPCEGCEAIFEYGNRRLTSTDTLPDFQQSDPKVQITGRVFKSDGKTPAKDVILYMYHTDREGLYKKKAGDTGWATRHGYIRGWVKTDSNGRYVLYTFRPASYPTRSEPEHIHITVKEPDKNPYYIDDILFDDDPLLTESKRDGLRNRGGSGIVTPRLENGIVWIRRDIILGMNIPNYN